MLDAFLLSQMNAADQAEVLEVIQSVSGVLAPFEPYLHWSVNRREHFVSGHQIRVIGQFMAGLFVVRYQERLFLARQFLNSNGWIWACVPLQNAQPDDRMLISMMEGAA